MWQVRLLGATEAVNGDRRLTGRDFGGVKQRQILEILALHHGRFVPKERLAELLWEGDPPQSYVGTLEGYVSLLRRALEPGVPARASIVLTGQAGYALDPERVRVDLARVTEAVQQATRRPAREALPALLPLLREADRELLESEPYAEWANAARSRHDRTIRSAAIAAATATLSLGRPQLAEDHARRAVSLDPMCEHAWQLTMQAQWRAGNRGGALHTYDRLRTLLADELGIAPSPQTQALATEIRREHRAAARPDARTGGRSHDLEALVRHAVDAVLGTGSATAISETTAGELTHRIVSVVSEHRAGLVTAGPMLTSA
jgi:DNA-binding SARP family transcriptional activator